MGCGKCATLSITPSPQMELPQLSYFSFPLFYEAGTGLEVGGDEEFQEWNWNRPKKLIKTSSLFPKIRNKGLIRFRG